jgi:hypothetical protein
MVDMSEVVVVALLPAFPGVEAVVVDFVVPDLEFAPDAADGAVFVPWPVAAASTVVVSETVSRRFERPFRMVAGATMVIERVTGFVGAESLPSELAVVSVLSSLFDVSALDVLPEEGVLVEELLLGAGAVSSLCCCITS